MHQALKAKKLKYRVHPNIMQILHSKKQLAIYLSKLSGFASPSHKAEQYVTNSEIAADIIWNAYLLGDIEHKSVTDLGCGPGMLGIGCAIMGSGKLVFVDMDEYALARASAQFAKLELELEHPPKAKFEQKTIELYEGKSDILIMNPPFGTRVKHADRNFLDKAFTIAPVIYSLHKTSTKEFIKKYAEKNGYRVTHTWDYSFPLKATQKFHTRKIHRIEVSGFRIEQSNKQSE